jgi:hypothetical protein
LAGVLFAAGRRTVTSWFRVCGMIDEFRPAYATARAARRFLQGAGTLMIFSHAASDGSSS